jgi:hypothetical protein
MDWTTEVRFPTEAEDFSSSLCVQTGSGAHPVSYPMGTGGAFFPGGKARPGRYADHSSPSSAEVKCEWELYLLSLHALPWRVAGQLYFNDNCVLLYLVFWIITERFPKKLCFWFTVNKYKMQSPLTCVTLGSGCRAREVLSLSHLIGPCLSWLLRTLTYHCYFQMCCECVLVTDGTLGTHRVYVEFRTGTWRTK